MYRYVYIPQKQTYVCLSYISIHIHIQVYMHSYTNIYILCVYLSRSDTETLICVLKIQNVKSTVRKVNYKREIVVFLSKLKITLYFVNIKITNAIFGLYLQRKRAWNRGGSWELKSTWTLASEIVDFKHGFCHLCYLEKSFNSLTSVSSSTKLILRTTRCYDNSTIQLSNSRNSEYDFYAHCLGLLWSDPPVKIFKYIHRPKYIQNEIIGLY